MINKNLNIIKSPKEIEINNLINITKYEHNMDFSKYHSNIKVVALYEPIYYLAEKFDDCYVKKFNNWEIVKKAKILYKGHHQPRKPGDPYNYLNYYNLIKVEVIKKQIKLAKSHGIYGFGIYYYWINGKILYDKPLNIYLKNKDFNFPFFLILKVERKNIECKRIKINIPLNKLIENIKIFLYDDRYIKINNNPIIGIYDPLNIKKIDEIILNWRKDSKKFGIGEIFILAHININQFNYSKNIKLFNGIYYFPKNNSELNLLLKNKNFYYYSGLIYKNVLNLNMTKLDYNIFRGSLIEWDNSPNNKNYFNFDEYSPEKFYILNKIIIEWTKIHKNLNNSFVFINSWNNWIEGSYLEPDDIYGYASLNALSKALFNLPFSKINYNLSNINKSVQIAVQAHIYYEDLISEIINNTNNIKYKYDLYITTNSIKKKNIIEKYVKKHSNAQKYLIKITKNKGRDILPMLIQLNRKIKYYKYICHIHSKKTLNNPKYGDNWRKYLYKNLLGNIEIVSEIISDFETNNKLGFIFPESYYECIEYTWDTDNIIKNYMNYILNKIFPGNNIKNDFDFPAGNMFWAKVDAIYQLFEQNIEKECPDEKNMSDYTILHAIERIWLFVVKLNGYYYKKIFKFF